MEVRQISRCNEVPGDTPLPFPGQLAPLSPISCVSLSGEAQEEVVKRAVGRR